MLTFESTEARRNWSHVLSKVEEGQSVVIRRRVKRVFMCQVEEIEEALGGCYGFAPEVFLNDDGSAAIWLPELEVFGEGRSLEEAQADLINAVLDYVGDWEDNLHSAPNHAQRRGWVRRVELALDRDNVAEVLFAS